MGEILNVVILGYDYYLEYANDTTNWEVKTKPLTLTEVLKYDALMQELSEKEDNLLRTFL